MLYPEVRILIEGNKILSSYVARVTIQDNAGPNMDRIELAIANPGGRFVVKKGSKVTCHLGYKGEALDWAGDFTVDEVGEEGGGRTARAIIVRGRSVDLSASDVQIRKSRTWQNTTIAAIVGKIATEHGLKGYVGDTVGTIPVRHEDQVEESDMALLARLAKRYGAVSKLKGSFWIFKKEGEGGDEFPTVTKKISDLTHWSGVPTIDRTRYKGVRAFWYNRERAQAEPVSVGEEPFYELRHNEDSSATAYQRAFNKFQEFEGKTGTFECTMLGDAKVIAEGHLRIEGISPYLDKVWAVTKVEHQYSPSDGFVTKCNCNLGDSDDDDEGEVE